MLFYFWKSITHNEVEDAASIVTILVSEESKPAGDVSCVCKCEGTDRTNQDDTPERTSESQISISLYIYILTLKDAQRASEGPGTESVVCVVYFHQFLQLLGSLWAIWTSLQSSLLTSWASPWMAVIKRLLVSAQANHSLECFQQRVLEGWSLQWSSCILGAIKIGYWGKFWTSSLFYTCCWPRYVE